MLCVIHASLLLHMNCGETAPILGLGGEICEIRLRLINLKVRPTDGLSVT